MPSFTPGYFDAKPALKTGDNEVLIRVGADRDAVGRAYPDGFDFEKERYIPGIFDSVELILSGTPHFLAVQAAPDVAGKTVRVQAVLRNDGEAAKAAVKFVVREAKSGKVAGRLTSEPVESGEGRGDDAGRPHPARRLPAMVARRPVPLHARSRQRRGHVSGRGSACASSSSIRRRAGRCSTASRISCAAATSRSTASSRTASAESLPWDEKWVRLLHQRVKDMHWNCLRYCIGFPPEAWYDIADEAGILIDDEFPIWFGGDVPKELQTRRTGDGICRMDARALEPSVRRDLGRLQ